MSAVSPRRLIVHIGHHKTGTTTIQDAFATGRVDLPGGRILYPAQMAHNYLCRHVETWLKTGEVLPGRPETPGLAAIAALMAAGEHDHTVISAEGFESVDPAGLHRVMAEFMLPHVEEHRVICYLRPHAERVLSSFAEQMKLGLFDGTPGQFHLRALKQKRFFYAPKMAPWRDRFGAALHVRPMLRAELAEGSILRDFLVTAFGADSPVRAQEGGAANEALCLEDLVLVRRAQQILAASAAGADQRLRHAMGWELALSFAAARRAPEPGPENRSEGISGGSSGGTRLALHRALARKIRTAYLEDAVDTDRMFFAGRPVLAPALDRMVEEAPAEAQSFEPSDHHSADALRGFEVMTQTLAAMLAHEGRDGGEWARFLVERRGAALKESPPPPAPLRPVPAPPAPVQPATAMAEAKNVSVPAEIARKPAPVLVPGQGINAERLAALLAQPGDPATLSQRLGHVLLHSPRDRVTLSAGELAHRLTDPALPPVLRPALAEFLLSLTFHHHARSLTGDLQALSPAALASRDDDLGQALRALNGAGGALPALAEAGIHYLRDDLVPAYARIEAARQAVRAGAPVGPPLRGLLALRDLPRLMAWAATPGFTPALPPLRDLAAPPPDTTLPVVVIGMEGAAYARHAARLVESAQGRAVLHLHLLGPAEGPLLVAPHLRQSGEEAPGLSEAAAKLRLFLRLPELLAQYDRPLMLAEAGMQVSATPAPLFDLLKGRDLLLNAPRALDTPRAHLAAQPWRHAGAFPFVAAPTPGARAFLEVLGRLHAGLAAETGAALVPGADQALLAASADLMRHQGRAVRILNRWLPPLSGMEQGKP